MNLKKAGLLRHYFFFLFVFCVFTSSLFAQTHAVAKPDIEKAIADKKLDAAEALVQKQVDQFYASRLPDSLNNYIFYIGKIEQLKTDPDKAIKKVEAFIQKIKSLSPAAATLRQTYVETGEYYGFAGKNNLAYKANQEALKITLTIPGRKPAQLGKIESNLGAYAQRMGDVNLSGQHNRRALAYLQSDPAADPESLYISYNNMGTMLWYASKLDSSLNYFDKAIATLKKTDPTPLNLYYRPALVLNNVSGIYGLLGKTTEAINALKTCILYLKTFIGSKEPHLKKNAAISLQFEATDNLAGIYKELGDFKKAHDLLSHSYQQKQQQLGKDNPAVFISQILLGQLYFAMKEYDTSLRYLNDGLEAIARADGDYTFYKADACNTLALLHDERKNKEQAASFYEKADALYEESLQGEYDNIYLDFISNAALFYAENKDTKKALVKAKKAYDYIVKTHGAQTLPASYQLLNLSEVYYLSGNYSEALTYSKQSLAAVNNAMRSGNNLLDSIKLELKKPKAILQKAKAEYALLKTKDQKELSRILSELNEAMAILERRKTILNDAEDIGLFMADQTELLKFIGKINTDLFKITNDRSYLNKLIGLHESAMYNRIRSRLDKNDTLQFAHVPAKVQATERSLKAAITSSLEGEGQHNQKMQAYFAAVETWNRFQEGLKKEYPRYYTMRYASIIKSLEGVRQLMPDQTTLVRYFFSNQELYALVADAKNDNIIPLPVHDLDKLISALSLDMYDAKKTGETLFSLYQQLWAPLAKEIRHKKIVLIPDGILYNLSFETLTSKKITSFKELATASLLAKHSIAYHYSLFLLGQKKQPSSHNSFIAFAPGFNDDSKKSYSNKSGNDALPDNNYLSLLPQPFTIDLAEKTQKLLGGNTFLHEQSTESSFKQNAGNHKIIHIGTHAESDNLHPEFSRLIFARNSSVSTDDNYLYLPEIYNCNLASELAVLTACESGKPGYEDGEGMISLAHAFNYAGSESILTGLWKIDEQSSAVILEAFYKNLKAGMYKDEALRQAKLKYLQGADGRTLAPQYWAGLVVMGDTSPIVFEPASGKWIWWIAGGMTIILSSMFIVRLKKSQTRRNHAIDNRK